MNKQACELCEHCNGRGTVCYNLPDCNQSTFDCPECRGTGLKRGAPVTINGELVDKANTLTKDVNQILIDFLDKNIELVEKNPEDIRVIFCNVLLMLGWHYIGGISLEKKTKLAKEIIDSFANNTIYLNDTTLDSDFP